MTDTPDHDKSSLYATQDNTQMIRVNLAGLNRNKKYNGGRYSPPPLEYEGIGGGGVGGNQSKIGTLLGA